MALLTSSRSTRVSADHCTTLSTMSRSKLKVQLSSHLRRGQTLRDVGLPLGGGVRQPLVAAARPRVSVFRSFSVCRM